MLKYVAGRIVAMLITLFIIITISFLIIRLMPMKIFDHPDVPPEVVKILEAQMHLDKPLLVQYGYFLKGIVLNWDWGISAKIRPRLPVFEVIAARIPVSMLINVLSLLIALPLGVIGGTLAALQRNKLPDHVISFFVVMCISIPSFVFATLLQYTFSFVFKIFPTLYRPSASTVGGLAMSITLPVIALALGPIATVTRYLRGELIETLDSEFLLLARTKGLSQRQAIIRHAFRNSCVPLVNIIVPMFTGILGGSLVIEAIFAIPGMGGMLVSSINAGDHPLTIALLIFYSSISLVTILLMDILYGILDPRIKMGGRK
jgi:oligopeptide transport system permease protein